MIATTCLVQYGQVSAGQEAALRTSMHAFSERSFGLPPEIQWIEVPKGSGFTAGEPSTSVLVMMQSNAPLSQPKRIDLLEALCDLWIEALGCSQDEVVGVIRDPESN